MGQGPGAPSPEPSSAAGSGPADVLHGIGGGALPVSAFPGLPPSHPLGQQGVVSATRVLSCGSDGVVRLWDFTTGRCMRRYEAHKGAVTALKWGWPGYAASGGADGAVHVWNVLTGQCVTSLDLSHTLPAGSDSILSDADFAFGDSREEDPDASVVPMVVVEGMVRSPIRRNVSPVVGMPPSALSSPAPERSGGAAPGGTTAVSHVEWCGPYLVCVTKPGVVRVCRWVVEVDSL